MQKSDSNALLGRVAIRAFRTSAELKSAISAAIADGDLEATKALVQEAESDHPGDPDLDVALLQGRTILSRAKWVDEALEAMHRELEDDHFSAALGHFREALCLSRGFPALKAMADAQADQQSKRLLPHNWRVAEVLLQEAVAAEPFFIPDADLQRQFELARHQEMIASAIHKADRAEFDGTLEEARRRLKELLVAFPNESVLAERLRTLDRRSALTTAPGSVSAQPESKSAAPLTQYHSGGALLVPKPRQTDILISGTSWNNIKNFTSLAATSAMLGAAGFLIWHHFSSTSQTSTRAIPTVSHRTPAAPPAFPKPSSAAIPAAFPKPITAALPAAIPAAPQQEAPPPAEEEAWQLVRTADDEAPIRAFLTAYPSSPHSLRARLRIAAIQWSKLDKTDAASVETYLRLHSRSPYKAEAEQLLQDLSQKDLSPKAVNQPDVSPKLDASPKDPNASPLAAVDAAPVVLADREAILEAVRGYLDAQTESAQQSSDDVIDEPVIDGEQATIQLHLKGAAGTQTLTFSLTKIAGVWKVQSAH